MLFEAVVEPFYLAEGELRFSVFVHNALVIEASCAVESRLAGGAHIGKLPYKAADNALVVMEELEAI